VAAGDYLLVVRPAGRPGVEQPLRVEGATGELAIELPPADGAE
jgi:hypothetical protein